MDVKIGKQGGGGSLGATEAAIWFWSVFGLFAAMWILLPTLLHTSHWGDPSEMQSIAPEWTLSTTKLPNLPSWILEIVNILTNRAFAAPFIAMQLCALLAFWSVWQLGRTVLDERLALLAVFSVFAYDFFTKHTHIYNHNTVLIAFWCVSIYLTFQAFQTNRKRYWIGAGIALGLAFYAKISAVFLVIAILTYMIMRKEGRKHWRTPGPYITTSLAFLVFLPNLIWLISNDFAPLSYAKDRPELLHWYQQALTPINFASKQLVYCIKTLIILIPVIGFIWQWKLQRHEQGKAKECEKFLFYCFAVPVLCHMIYCGIYGVHLRMSYGAAFWVFIGLWLILRFQPMKEPHRFFRKTVILMMVVVLFTAAEWSVNSYSGKFHGNYYPMRELGTTSERLWQSHASGNIPYIASDCRNLSCGGFAGIAAQTMSVRPSVIMPQGTWANDDDLNRKGGMIIWERHCDDREMPEYLRQRFPEAIVLPEAPELPYNVGRETRILRIGIAIVPPPENR